MGEGQRFEMFWLMTAYAHEVVRVSVGALSTLDNLIEGLHLGCTNLHTVIARSLEGMVL